MLELWQFEIAPLLICYSELIINKYQRVKQFKAVEHFSIVEKGIGQHSKFDANECYSGFPIFVCRSLLNFFGRVSHLSVATKSVFRLSSTAPLTPNYPSSKDPMSTERSF